VYTLLRRLLERSGQGKVGSITTIYTVLVEDGDMDEPIADEVRDILDGQIVLSREIAARGLYPAVDVPASISRVMDAVVTREHAEQARLLRALLGGYAQKRDLLAVGAYVKGSDPKLDAAVALMPELERFLGQSSTELCAFERTCSDLARLAQRGAR
jgi:flagellar biosynthesis/type III secretory pathway ATPase